MYTEAMSETFTEVVLVCIPSGGVDWGTLDGHGAAVGVVLGPRVLDICDIAGRLASGGSLLAGDGLVVWAGARVVLVEVTRGAVGGLGGGLEWVPPPGNLKVNEKSPRASSSSMLMIEGTEPAHSKMRRYWYSLCIHQLCGSETHGIKP